MGFSKELEVALYAAKVAGAIQIDSQKSISNVELKKDRSPVTEVDKKCEKLIKKALLSEFKNDGFLGEESKKVIGSSGRRWIVDPLDGTRPYIHNIPTYSVLIALEEDGVPVVGVVHFPALKETYYASKGGGAFMNGEPISVSDGTTITDAMASALGVAEEAKTSDGKKLLSLLNTVDYNYGFMDAYSYMGVASGKLEFCISLIDNSWDRAAAACIIIEAGGEYSDLSSNKTIYSKTFLISNRNIHKKIISKWEKYDK